MIQNICWRRGFRFPMATSGTWK